MDAACDTMDLGWGGTSSITHDPTLFKLNFAANNNCGYIRPRFSPQSSTSIMGGKCNTAYGVICSAPCDEEGNYKGVVD